MDLSKRINRVIGQLKGIEKMSDNKRDCSEILQQISAIKKAIDGLSKEIIVSDVCRNMNARQTEKMEKVVERAINL